MIENVDYLIINYEAHYCYQDKFPALSKNFRIEIPESPIFIEKIVADHRD